MMSIWVSLRYFQVRIEKLKSVFTHRQPGTPVNRRMCLWNGLIAAAPGHPFLAKVIETVVNNVRNRFTSVDVDNMFCPDPELSILHAFDTLFTAGPCILGSMVNKVLGRHGQTPFEAGELDPWEASRHSNTEEGSDFVIGVDDSPMLRIPGRTIILHQNKWDVSCWSTEKSRCQPHEALNLTLFLHNQTHRWDHTDSLSWKRI